MSAARTWWTRTPGAPPAAPRRPRSPGLAWPWRTSLATALAVGGDAALAAVAGLPGYAGYLIRPDGTETWTSGIQFAAP